MKTQTELSKYTLPSGAATVEKELDYLLATAEFTYRQKGIRKTLQESLLENLIMQQKIEELENELAVKGKTK